jgi:hypothetical protein
VPPAHPAASSTGRSAPTNYENKNYKNKKLWVIQKIFLFAKNKN